MDDNSNQPPNAQPYYGTASPYYGPAPYRRWTSHGTARQTDAYFDIGPLDSHQPPNTQPYYGTPYSNGAAQTYYEMPYSNGAAQPYYGTASPYYGTASPYYYGPAPQRRRTNYGTGRRTDAHFDISLLEQIVEILQNSTIAKERAKDALSKFWVAYKTVSGEYDDDMLERCNGNMDIVLIFAGLFSAVNTAFIIAMQPNPIDITNILLIQLVQNTSTQPMVPSLPTPTDFSSSKSWMQALAYASLAFSLLAAYGAVMGKQWLGHYKTNRFGRGSLKDRCQQRHRKFQELKAWQFENVLRSFPVLLQISLLLFSMSLGAMLWTQQWPISILIIATTTFGGLCHAIIIIVSLIRPDSPFQTPVSLVIQAVFGHFRPHAGFHYQYEDSSKSAMAWILETSRNPDVLRSVVELMPTMPELPNVNLVSLCTEVRDMFKACFDQHGIPIQHDSALAYGKALIYFSSNHDDVRDMLHTTTQEWNLWQRWRALYLPQALEQCRNFYRRMGNTIDPDSKLSFQADTRATLRMTVAAGIDGFAHPNDDTLIWNGQFRLEFDLSGINWLLDCAEHFYKIDDVDAAGDALLLFSDMQREPLHLIQDRIAPFLNDSRSRRFRHIALRAACRSLDDTYRDESPYRHPFSHAVLKAICPMVPNECDKDDVQITNAINLLNFTEWPEGSDLAISPLPEIQLLVLLVSPAPKVDNLARYTHYCRALIRLMGKDQPEPFPYLASNIVCSARQDLIKFTAVAGADKSLRDSVLSELCPALITTLFTCSNDLATSIGRGHLIPCFRLAFTLAKSSDWHPHLIRDGCIEEWIVSTLMYSGYVAQRPRNHTPRTRVRIRTPTRTSRTPSPSPSSPSPSSPYRTPSPTYQYFSTRITGEEARSLFYLAGISLRIAPPEQAASCFSAVTNMHWWDLMRSAWHLIEFYTYDELDDGVESLPALVRGTEWHMPPDASKTDLESLDELLAKTLDALRQQQMPDESIISAVAGLKNTVCQRLVDSVSDDI